MPSKEEKKRRAQIVEALVEEDTKKAIEQMPISFADLAALFDYLDEQLGVKGCAHTSDMTKAFLNKRNLNPEEILMWLEEFGGNCDCEILANVEECWESEIRKNT